MTESTQSSGVENAELSALRFRMLRIAPITLATNLAALERPDEVNEKLAAAVAKLAGE